MSKAEQKPVPRTRQFKPGPIGPDIDRDAEEVLLADGRRRSPPRFRSSRKSSSTSSPRQQ